MSCSITQDRTEPCKDKIGGIKRVWFSAFSDTIAWDTTTPGTIAIDSAGTISGVQYDVRMASGLTNTITSSRENGTTFVTQSLTLQLKGLTATDEAEILALSRGRWIVVIEDNNGSGWVIGREYGADVTTGTAQTGTALGDLYGYTITIEGMERELPLYNSNPSGLITP